MKRNGSENSIELVSCPGGGGNCSDHLKEMNSYMEQAREMIVDKDYKKGINLLADAYLVSFRVSQDTCVKCADLFRDIILKSISDHRQELEKLASGIFNRKKYRGALAKADEIYTNLKKQHP